MKARFLHLIFLTTPLLAPAAVSAEIADGEPVLIAASPAAEPPVIDGNLNDPAWKDGSWAWEFWTGTDEFPSPQRTEVCLVYSATDLFVAFRCHEEWMNELVAVPRERDGRVWEDDCIEVFIDRNIDQKTYCHFIANVLGNQFDQLSGDDRWNADWTVATRRGKDQWTAEVSIPFAALGGAPNAGDIWALNLNRERKPREEVYAWSPTGPSFHVPSRFGRVVFLANPVAISVEETGDLFLGRGNFRVRIRSGQETGWTATAVSRGENDVHTENTVLRFEEGENEKVFDLPYRITEGGEGVVKLTLATATSGEFRFRRYYPFLIPEAEDLLREAEVSQLRAEELVGKLVAESTAAVDAGQRLTDYAARLESVRDSLARPAELGREGWQEQATLCGELVREYRSLVLQAQSSLVFAEGKTLPDFTVTFHTPVEKIFPDAVPGGDVAREVVVSLARREHEAVQLSVFPFAGDLDAARVTLQAVTAKDGSQVEGAPRVTAFEVGLVETEEPAYPVERTGLWPDPLLPPGPLTVPAGEARSIWMDVYAAASTPAGDYVAGVTVQPATGESVTLELRIRVWDFELPLESTLATVFSFNESAVKAYYGMEDLSPELRREYYAFLLDHRLNPTDLYEAGMRPRPEDISFCLERGMTAFNAGHIAKRPELDDAAKESIRSRFAETYATLESQGLTKRAFTHIFDEPEPKDFEALKEAAAVVGGIAPGLRRLTNTVPAEDLYGSVEIWAPDLAAFQAGAAAARKEAGNEVWWYAASKPVHPFPNFFIDYPGIDHRILFWMMWKHEIGGFVYYSVNWGWMNNARGDARWPDVPWNTKTFQHYNGDGQLIYPGPNGEPWSSIRLEMIRDGIEDYEYLAMLKRLVESAGDSPEAKTAAGLLEVPPKLVESTTAYTQDPYVLLGYREKVADAILKLAGTK